MIIIFVTVASLICVNGPLMPRTPLRFSGQAALNIETGNCDTSSAVILFLFAPLSVKWLCQVFR